LELRKLELFDLVAQEQYMLHPARNLTKSRTTVSGESNKTEIEHRRAQNSSIQARITVRARSALETKSQPSRKRWQNPDLSWKLRPIVKCRTEIWIGNHTGEGTRTEAARSKTDGRENWSAVLVSSRISHGERPILGHMEKRVGTEHQLTRPRK
jgi:hypothetical protein